MIRSAILYRRHWLVARVYFVDAIAGITFALTIYVTVWLIRILPALYTIITGIK